MKHMMFKCCLFALSQLYFAPFADIFKVDVGDSVVVSVLHHAASQAPLLGVRAELQDLVIPVTIISTWI